MTNHQSNPDSQRAAPTLPTRALIALWLLAIAGGWYFVERHEFAKSDAASARAVDSWPINSKLVCDRGRPALVLFLHPKCPCSRATLAELDRLLASAGQPTKRAIQLIVVATVPKNEDESWWDTGTIAKSSGLPNALIFIDRDGEEAARFGATTSGTVMYFDGAGACGYAGGITVTRGHEGRSSGGDVVAALVRGERVDARSLPVFGCRLCLPEMEPDREIAGPVRGESNTTPESRAI